MLMLMMMMMSSIDVDDVDVWMWMCSDCGSWMDDPDGVWMSVVSRCRGVVDAIDRLNNDRCRSRWCRCRSVMLMWSDDVVMFDWSINRSVDHVPVHVNNRSIDPDRSVDSVLWWSCSDGWSGVWLLVWCSVDVVLLLMMVLDWSIRSIRLFLFNCSCGASVDVDPSWSWCSVFVVRCWVVDPDRVDCCRSIVVDRSVDGWCRCSINRMNVVDDVEMMLMLMLMSIRRDPSIVRWCPDDDRDVDVSIRCWWSRCRSCRCSVSGQSVESIQIDRRSVSISVCNDRYQTSMDVDPDRWCQWSSMSMMLIVCSSSWVQWSVRLDRSVIRSSMRSLVMMK